MSVKKGLGRGLNALFGNFEDNETTEEVVAPVKAIKEMKETQPDGAVLELALDQIFPNKNQPRKNFDSVALEELAASIRTHGVIQPIVVVKNGSNYMIIAGERRYRASKLAGFKTIPAIIKEYTDVQVQEISIIENLQREDLNPIEAARALKQLMDDYKWTQERVSERIGISRPSVANAVRLLTLPTEVIRLIEENRLSAGHAKSLLSLEDREAQIKLALASCDNKLSVRDLEKAIKEMANPQTAAKKPVQEQSLELKELITTMQRTFATKVTALGNDRRGRIYIDYYSRDDLDRIHEMMTALNHK